MTNPFRPRFFLPGLASAVTPQPVLDPQSSPLAQPGNGPIAGYTNTFSLNLVNFDWITWHNYEWENWIVVDALLNAAIGFLNIKGFWKPATDYLAGQSVFDPDNVSLLYLCLAPHTSSTDFEADKPIYWKQVDQAKPPVSSVFSRIGDIVAEAADYAAFYADKAATQTALNARLPLAGGTMTGPIVLAGAPTDALNPATKAYADAIRTDMSNSIAATDAAIRQDFAAADAQLLADINALDAATTAALATKLNLSGGTMTGALLLSAAPTALLQAATKGYVDEKIAALPGAGGALVVAASATPIVLTGTSPNVIVITGSGTQVVTMPSAANAGLGRVFTIINLSTGTVNVQANNASAIGQPIEAGMTATLTCISSSGGGANSWTIGFTGTVVRNGTGNVLHSVNPTITGATFDAPLLLPASAAALSPIRIPQGGVPASPANGDIWTTSEGIFVRINGATINLSTRVAEQNLPAAGQTLLRFDQVPAEAVSIVMMFNNLTWTAADLRLNFTNAAGQVHGMLLQASGAAYTPPVATSFGYTPLTRDTDNNITGMLLMERLGIPPGSEAWFFSGVYRTSNVQLTLSGRVIRNAGTVLTQPQLSLPASAAFASGSVTCRWRL